jgi:outer membrane protein W
MAVNTINLTPVGAGNRGSAAPVWKIDPSEAFSAADLSEESTFGQIAKSETSENALLKTASSSDPLPAPSLSNQWRWGLNSGYRRDEFNWSIAGFIPPAPADPAEDLLPGLPPQYRNQSVNIISELTWSDIEVLQLEFELQKRFRKTFRIKGSLAYGLIFDGQNQDSDYAGNDRTLEFSRSNNSADDGETWDLSFGFGYEFFFVSDKIGLTPFVGLSLQGQNFTMTDGYQTVSNFGFPVDIGPLAGLDSSYDADWYGPWIGLEGAFYDRRADLEASRQEFFTGVELHYAHYEAWANWNLRGDLAHPVSFEQESDGWGGVLYVGYKFFFNPRWSLNLNGKYQRWQTDSGTHTFLGSDGTSSDTRLNEVDWKSYSVTAGVTCRW